MPREMDLKKFISFLSPLSPSRRDFFPLREFLFCVWHRLMSRQNRIVLKSWRPGGKGKREVKEGGKEGGREGGKGGREE